MKYVISRRVSLAQMFRRREAKLEALQETCEQLRKALQLVKYIYTYIYHMNIQYIYIYCIRFYTYLFLKV